MRERLLVVLVVAAAACDPPPPAVVEPAPLPPLASAATTLEHTLVPRSAPTPSDDNPALPEHILAAIDSGLGALDDGDGEPLITLTLDGSQAPAPGANRRRLVRFVHLADAQLMDDESPTRKALFDSRDVNSALRPQEPYMCRMLNAAVRTINALHAAAPIDFVLLGGDNADSAQHNEITWVLDILTGAPSVHCDSGDDDDMFPSDPNDGKDPFVPVGLDVPWRWVNGNHDVLVQGTFKIDDTQQSIALGTEALLGTRDYSIGGYGVVGGGDGFIPDDDRRLLDGSAVLELVGAHDDGHGVADVDRARGKAFYAFDAGDAITFMILDTAHGNGGAGGVLQQRDLDQFVIPALDDALARERVVVLASHHAITSLSADGGTFGETEPDALLADDWRAVIAQYPNVLFSMVAHSHEHRVRPITTPAHTYWEVATSALADWPHQLRVVEIYDNDNGTLSMETAAFDFAVDDDAPAALGRTLGLIDALSGWNDPTAGGDVEDRNVALIAPKP